MALAGREVAVLSPDGGFLRHHRFRAARRGDCAADQVFPGLRLENVVTAYARYLLNTVWPAHLAVFYPLLKQIPVLHVALAAAALLAISVLVLAAAKSRPYLAVGWLWYLGTLVPVIGLLQVGDQALADRYTYFPLIGIFVAVIWTLRDLAPRFPSAKTWFAAVAVLGLGTCLALTENQLQFWRDSETLFVHSLAVTADNVTARLNLGSAYQEQNRTTEAIEEYRAALSLDPNCHEAYNNLGRLLNDAGRPAEALDYCRAAVQLDPRSPQSHIGLGIVLAELGRYDEAMNEFAQAARLDPNDPTPHFQTARALLRQGRDAEAVAQLREALRLAPEDLRMLICTARVLAADENTPARDGVACLGPGPKKPPNWPVARNRWCWTRSRWPPPKPATSMRPQGSKQATDFALTNGDKEDAAKMQQRLELYRKHQTARISFKTE